MACNSPIHDCRIRMRRQINGRIIAPFSRHVYVIALEENTFLHNEIFPVDVAAHEYKQEKQKRKTANHYGESFGNVTVFPSWGFRKIQGYNAGSAKMVQVFNESDTCQVYPVINKTTSIFVKGCEMLSREWAIG